MKIQFLELNEFIRLQFSRIKNIRLDFNDYHTHLFLGTNGSGKSSLLKEIIPTAPVKSQFSKNGSKIIELEHNGSYYRLIYSPQEGHEFYHGENTENLNTGGTQEIQKELILKHFGISSDIQDILQCSLSICDMVPSKRKQLLMGLNPVDVSIFIDEYKTVKKKVTSLYNNLDRLYQRQKQLVEQKLPEEIYQKMLTNHQELEHQEKTLLVWATRVDEELRKYDDDSSSIKSPEILIEKIKWIYRQLASISSLIRNTQEKRFFEIPAQLEMIGLDNEKLSTQLVENITQLDNYVRQQKEFQSTDKNLNIEISDLLKRINSVNIPEEFRPIPEHSLLHCNETIELVQKRLVEITYISFDQLIDKSELIKLYQLVIDLDGTIQSLSKEVEYLKHQKEELLKTIKTYEVGKDCQLNSCELYSSYQKHHDKKQTELISLDTKIKELEIKIESSKLLHNKKNASYQTQTKVWEILNDIKEKTNKFPELWQFISKEDLFQLISTSPLSLSNKFNHIITLSEQFYEREEYRKNLVKLEKLKETQTTKQKISIEILTGEIDKYRKLIDQLRHQLSITEIKSNKLNLEHNQIITYRNLVNECSRLQQDYESLLTNSINQASRTYLLQLKSSIDKLRNTIRINLSELSQTIKDQESLIVRLDQEVDKIISELRPKYEKAQKVEKALSELPIRYTKNFVNDLIETSNYIMGRIFTYPIKLIPYNDLDECDFTFPVLVDNEIKIKDISQGSTGQKDLISLAFNLALIIELKFNDYPVCVDEIDRALDTTHKHRLSEFLTSLVDQGIVSQLFVINHSKAMIDMLATDSDITVLNSDNITVPKEYNLNAEIIYY